MKRNRGFTLIELLVVIAIIGILSSVVLASLNSARAKARDARRKSDLAQIRNAMELYLTDNNGVYPGVQGFFLNREAVNGNNNINVLQPNYIRSIPDDPLHVPESLPTYLHLTKDFTDASINITNCPSLVVQSGSKFGLYAKLEKPTAADIATMTGGDSYDQCVYQVTNPTYGYNYRVGN